MVEGWRLEKLSPSGISWTRVADYYSRQAAESGMRLRAGPRSSYRVIACWLPEQSATPALVRGGFSRQAGLIVDVLLMLLAVGGFGAWYSVAASDWDCDPRGASWSQARCAAEQHARGFVNEAKRQAVSGYSSDELDSWGCRPIPADYGPILRSILLESERARGCLWAD